MLRASKEPFFSDNRGDPLNASGAVAKQQEGCAVGPGVVNIRKNMCFDV